MKRKKPSLSWVFPVRDDYVPMEGDIVAEEGNEQLGGSLPRLLPSKDAWFLLRPEKRSRKWLSQNAMLPEYRWRRILEEKATSKPQTTQSALASTSIKGKEKAELGHQDEPEKEPELKKSKVKEETEIFAVGDRVRTKQGKDEKGNPIYSDKVYTIQSKSSRGGYYTLIDREGNELPTQLQAMNLKYLEHENPPDVGTKVTLFDEEGKITKEQYVIDKVTKDGRYKLRMIDEEKPEKKKFKREEFFVFW